jgi:hypothetical protein
MVHIFVYQKYQFWNMFEGLWMDNFMAVCYFMAVLVYVIYGHLVFCGNFSTFFSLWSVVPRQIWQPWFGRLGIIRLRSGKRKPFKLVYVRKRPFVKKNFSSETRKASLKKIILKF